MSYLKEFTKGILKENPNLVMLLGMCPTLAVTTMAVNGLGMGLATTFVLVCSNLVISLLKKIIPSQVRLPCFIVIISGFVTLVGMLLQKFIPSLYDALGLFLSLITVNCIILGRAEMFACKNKVIPSVLDGLGMGVGFTLSLLTVGSFREILGSGTWFGLTVMPGFIQPMTIFILPAGGFFSLGIIIAIVGKISKKKPKDITCTSCPNRDACRFADTEAAEAVKEDK
ncbi:MAG TPA: electron transport complex subunit RsxE [Ruminococcaceae bacterium]|nr:electron transport complex subunit RsxE [Oscillospiraceae bacterium]